jgi:hypothetical protein
MATKFGIQKKGTGKAVSNFDFGGAAAVYSNVYKEKPGQYNTAYYQQSYFPQSEQATYLTGQTPVVQENKKDQEEKQKEIQGKLRKGGQITKGKNGGQTVIKKFGHEGAIDPKKAQITKLLKKGGKVK